VTHRVHVEVLPLRFGDVDYARILYYPRLLHYCHVAMEGFFGEITGESYAHLLAERNLGFPTVHLEATYLEPLPYGTDLRIAVDVEKIGESSLVLRYEERGGAEGGVRARVKGTVVCVAMDRFESTPIPEDIRRALQPYLVSKS